MSRLALLTVPALPSAARVVRATLTAALGEVATDLRDELLLAVTEAVTNATRHAYLDRDQGDVVVSIVSGERDHVVTVVDHGVGFDAPTIDPGAGFGMKLMRATSAACEHTPTDGGGTTVRLAFAA